MRPHVEVLARSLLREGDILVDESSPPNVAKGYVGRAFCPTTRARRVLERAGAELLACPPHAVLREVNGRAFCAGLGQTLEGAELVVDLDAALRKLATSPPPEIATAWRAKRVFGMAGRGQRVITPVAPAAMAEADRSFLRAAMALGGVQIEPQVSVVREFGLHGMIDAAGTFALGKIVVQRCDAHGQWLETTLATVSEASHVEDKLRASATTVAEALHRAGYFGPFGIDAFTYRDTAGEERLQPRTEINARYSMGFAVGFGSPCA